MFFKPKSTLQLVTKVVHGWDEKRLRHYCLCLCSSWTCKTNINPEDLINKMIVIFIDVTKTATLKAGFENYFLSIKLSVKECTYFSSDKRVPKMPTGCNCNCFLKSAFETYNVHKGTTYFMNSHFIFFYRSLLPFLSNKKIAYNILSNCRKIENSTSLFEKCILCICLKQ